MVTEDTLNPFSVGMHAEVREEIKTLIRRKRQQEQSYDNRFVTDKRSWGKRKIDHGEKNLFNKRKQNKKKKKPEKCGQ